jgi:hypothetical protein
MILEYTWQNKKHKIAHRATCEKTQLNTCPQRNTTLDQIVDTCTLALRVGFKKINYPNNIINKFKA